MIKDGIPGSQTILTACYDGFVRVWDIRKMNPKCLEEIKVGDQCWDFVLDANETGYTLAAGCVYDAAYFVNLTKEWKIISKYPFFLRFCIFCKCK